MEKSINKLTITSLFAVCMVVAAAIIPAAAGAQPMPAAAAKPSAQSIADIAIANGNFKTLVAALTCTGLVPAVSGDRQLTVFAPTDEAFEKLGVDENTVCSADLSKYGGLTNVLTYHVTSGRRVSTSVLASPSYRMLNGERLTRAELSKAGLGSTDISARNGVIHVINTVLLP